MRFASTAKLFGLISLTAYTTNGSSFSQLEEGIATGYVELSGTIRFSRTLTIPAGHNVTIRAASNATALLDGQGLGPLFRVEGQLRVLNLTISNGKADFGGAFYVVKGTLDIVECTLRGNVAIDSGGVVFNDKGSVQFHGGIAENNTAMRGGVVYNDQGSLNITRGLFYANTAGQAGGVGYNYRGSSMLFGATFLSNAVTNEDDLGYGGVFYNEEHNGMAQHLTWEYNTANWGGVMYNDAGRYDVLDSQCRHNWAMKGGCFYFTRSGHVISGGTYSYNVAVGLGAGHSVGGAFFDEAPTLVQITGIACESNRAESGGCCFFDAIGDDAEDASIQHSLFRNNTVSRNGGSIHINDPEARFLISDSQFLDGSSGTGGFLYSAIGKKQILIRRSTFMRGYASDRGGVIFTTSALTVRTSTFTASEAFKGGVLFVGNNREIDLNSVLMKGNRATLFGGAIYNERSESMTFKESTLMDNVADVSGGGIYIQAQSSILQDDGAVSSQLINNSASSGGAVSVQAGVSLEIRGLSFISNGAVRGAAHCGSGGNLVLDNTFFSSNVATGEGGALYLEPGALASILESTVFNNSATAGGFAYVSDSALLTAVGSRFNYNRAHSGGAIAASGGTITAEATGWISNVGDHGGALFLADSQFVSAGGCIYNQNRALYGGIASLEAGGELFLNETDSGSDNRATYGGGVAFYDHRTTERPPYPPPNVTATARFGATFATGLASLRATHQGPEVNDRDFVNPIRFEAFDDQGSAYLSPDIETIELDPLQGSLTGTSLLHLQDGYAETSGILLSHKPDANVTIVARVAHLDVVTTLNVTLRGCFLGEVGSDCRACTDSAKYSFDPTDEVCLDCPKHASCNSEEATDLDSKGALLILKAGYWRSGPFSTNIRKCPYAKACKGGVDLLTTENSCRENHRGPMCTLCKNGEDTDNKYLLDRSAGKCYKCSKKFLNVLTIVLVLIIAFLVVAPIAVVIVLSHDHNLLFTDFLRETGRSLERSRLVRTIDALMPIIKIVFVFSQVVSSEYSTFLFVNYPTMFDKVIVVLSFSQNFALQSLFASLCIRINHYSELLSVTLVPIAIFASSELINLVASYQAAADNLRKKIRNYTTFVKLITLFIVYSTASIVICATFRCDDDFDEEGWDSRYLKMSYLAVDYSISCKKPVHKIFVIYSAVMVFVYPVGVPLYFFCLLWLNRQIINPNAQELAERILNRGLENTGSMKTGDEYKSNEALTGKYDDVIAERDMRLQALRYTRAATLCEEYEALRSLTPGLDTLSSNLVASHARLDRKIAHLGFLFCDYSPGCWWFESVECLRRLFLTAVFPAVYSVDNDAGLLYSTFLLSTLFLGIYMATQPFFDEQVNQFAVLMHAALSLILFLTIILYSEERLDSADSARWDRQAIGVVLVLLSTCLGPIMLVFHAQLGGFQLYSACCNRCRHTKTLLDSDQEVVAEVEDEEQRDSGEHSDVAKDYEVVQKIDKTTSEDTQSSDEGSDAHEIQGPDGDDKGNDDRELQRHDDSSSESNTSKGADSPITYFAAVDFDVCRRASCL